MFKVYKNFLPVLLQIRYDEFLTHFSPVSCFYTPWKCDNGLKWVTGITFLKIPIFCRINFGTTVFDCNTKFLDNNRNFKYIYDIPNCMSYQQGIGVHCLSFCCSVVMYNIIHMLKKQWNWKIYQQTRVFVTHMRLTLCFESGKEEGNFSHTFDLIQFFRSAFIIFSFNNWWILLKTEEI